MTHTKLLQGISHKKMIGLKPIYYQVLDFQVIQKTVQTPRQEQVISEQQKTKKGKRGRGGGGKEKEKSLILQELESENPVRPLVFRPTPFTTLLLVSVLAVVREGTEIGGNVCD